tara:strand:- start:2873 stop:3361 length:489 start_codon:yes stop_codon:yes gene_type:complete
MNNVVKIEKKHNKVNYEINKNHIVTLVPHHYIGTIWNDVEKYLQKAVDRSNGRWSIESLKAALEQGQQELWVIFTEEDNNIIGTATTEFIYYPDSKRVAVQYLGGEDLPNWAWNYLKKVEAWAKDNNCDGIECTARYGVWKWLGKSGWEKTYTIFEKRFNNG